MHSSDDDAVSMVESFGDDVVARHPDDVERWYTSKSACEAAKTAPHRGLHNDCFTRMYAR